MSSRPKLEDHGSRKGKITIAQKGRSQIRSPEGLSGFCHDGHGNRESQKRKTRILQIPSQVAGTCTKRHQFDIDR